MNFLVDSMLPPRIAELLHTAGHDATTPAQIGAHNLGDDLLIQLADDDGRVIITENARDLADVASCAVLLVRKAWWPSDSLAERIVAAVDRWAVINDQPGPWAHWLQAELR